MTRLTESISATKEAQVHDYASLPRADFYREHSPYMECRSVSQVLKKLGEKEPDYVSLPHVTLLRCAIADLSKGKAEEEGDPTAEEILRVLEGRIPWLLTEEGYKFKVDAVVHLLVLETHARLEIHILHLDFVPPFCGGAACNCKPFA